MTSSEGRAEPFPALATQPLPYVDNNSSPIVNRPTASSSLTGRLRRVSQSFEESNLPEGFFAATGGIASSILSRPTAAGARSNSASGASSEIQQTSPNDPPSRQNTIPTVAEEAAHDEVDLTNQTSTKASKSDDEPPAAVAFDNGYHFPPHHSFKQSTILGLRTFWNYFLTPVGFCVTLYGLNVVAWGGMLFLLLW